MRWLAFLLLATSATASPPEVYVWQRLWTPAVDSAIRNSTGLFAGYRVLAAETDRGGHLKAFAVNWRVANTAVVRIDGSLGRFDAPRLLRELSTLKAQWPPGVALEIDYDCGTASLAAYARFLAQVRTLHPVRLSITALPAWLQSDDFVAVLAQIDEAVLQLHAVRSPAQGLFDAKLARRWVDQIDRYGKPFRVALPDYGTRVVWSETGAVVAMESETPRLISGASADELTTTPQSVASLLADLDRRPPRHLSGIVWFRLPVAGDERIWSLATLKAVIHRLPLTPLVQIDVRQGLIPGSRDVLLVNDGPLDAALPPAIHVPPPCASADGVGGYRYEAQKKTFVRLQNVLLRAHHARVIGWVRCTAGRGDFDVEP
jgi:hypothetical protein